MRGVDYDVLLDLRLEERADTGDHANTHRVWRVSLRRLGLEGGGGWKELPAKNDAGGEEKVVVSMG